MSKSRVIDRDLGWKKFREQMRGLSNAHVTVGLHADAKPYEQGQGEAATVAQVASFHEFGDGVPQRSFMRPTVDGNQEKYASMLQREAGLIIDGKLSVHDALALLGEVVAVDIKRAITDMTDPPLAESTIAAKKAKAAYLGEKKAQAYADSGANPLIDTGHMRHSVTYKTTVLGKTEGPEDVAGGE